MTQALPALACGRCQAPAEAFAPQCPKCGAFNSIRPPVAASPFAFGYGGGATVSSNGPRLLNVKNTVLSLDEEFSHTPSGLHVFDKVMKGGIVLGKNGVGTSLVFCGESGVGKTSMLLHILNGYAKADHRAVYFTAEQEDRAVLATARLFGLQNEFVDIVSIPRGSESLQVADRVLLQTQAKIAVFDSVQKMKVLVDDIARPITRIIVSRLNKFGEMHGEREQEHDPDTLLWADYTNRDDKDAPRLLHTTKNRHGQLEEAFYWMKDEKIWSEEEWKAAEKKKGKKR